MNPRELVKIAAARSRVFTVAFTPDANGPFEAILRVVHDVRRIDPIEVALRGTGRSCVDGDHDTYGDGCNAGMDCDDARADVNQTRRKSATASTTTATTRSTTAQRLAFTFATRTATNTARVTASRSRLARRPMDT